MQVEVGRTSGYPRKGWWGGVVGGNHWKNKHCNRVAQVGCETSPCRFWRLKQAKPSITLCELAVDSALNW